jgi:tyrosyl-tRNA synthetase
VPILVGTDGVQKMSKSLDNYIAVNDPPDQMFGKLMSIPDSAIGDYLRLLTDVSMDEIDEWMRQAEASQVNPRDIKERLALTVVGDLHSPEQATEARDEFARVYRQRELPSEMPEYQAPRESRLVTLLVESGTARTNNEARRLVTQGGVRIDGERLDDPETVVRVEEPRVLQVGRRRFVRLTPNSSAG